MLCLGCILYVQIAKWCFWTGLAESWILVLESKSWANIISSVIWAGAFYLPFVNRMKWHYVCGKPNWRFLKRCEYWLSSDFFALLLEYDTNIALSILRSDVGYWAVRFTKSIRYGILIEENDQDMLFIIADWLFLYTLFVEVGYDRKIRQNGRPMNKWEDLKLQTKELSLLG